MFIITELAETPVNPTVINITKADERDQNELLKNLMKQRPLRVSHLLQDNMPKCKNLTCLMYVFSH